MFTLNVFNCFATTSCKDSILYPVFATIQNILISFVLVGFEAVILKVALNSICIFSFATNELPTLKY
jgi:hypothetical protein